MFEEVKIEVTGQQYFLIFFPNFAQSCIEYFNTFFIIFNWVSVDYTNQSVGLFVQDYFSPIGL